MDKERQATRLAAVRGRWMVHTTKGFSSRPSATKQGTRRGAFLMRLTMHRRETSSTPMPSSLLPPLSLSLPHSLRGSLLPWCHRQKSFEIVGKGSATDPPCRRTHRRSDTSFFAASFRFLVFRLLLPSLSLSVFAYTRSLSLRLSVPTSSCSPVLFPVAAVVAVAIPPATHHPWRSTCQRLFMR